MQARKTRQSHALCQLCSWLYSGKDKDFSSKAVVISEIATSN